MSEWNTVSDGDTESALAAQPGAVNQPAPSIVEGDWWRGLANVAGASQHEAFQTGYAYSRADDFREGYDTILSEINHNRAPEAQLANPYGPSDHDAANGTRMRSEMRGTPSEVQSELESRIWQELMIARSEDPGRFANLPQNPGEFADRVRVNAAASIDAANKARANAAPMAAAIGGFLGNVVPSLEDPVNILSMGLGAPAAAGYLRFMLQEGAAAAGATAIETPNVAKWRAEIGKPMTKGEMLGNVIGAGVGGAAFAGGGKFLAHNVVAPAWRGLIGAITKDGDAVPPSVRAAAQVVADQQRRADQNPLTDATVDEHRDNLATATVAVDESRPQALPKADVTRAADPKVDAQQVDGSAGVKVFDPRAIVTDADMMQYKRGANEQGVTDRLEGVPRWNSYMAGQVLVFEANDGRLIVADGHQRLALARRAIEGGQDPAEVKLYGVVLREKDGVTPRQARVIAALKNIAEGSGGSLDAASVLREAPEGTKLLPPRSPLVRRAQDLSRLSSDAWGMAWNGVADEDHAAMVGRMVQDQKLHAPILSYLTKAAPETREEAEITIRQALEAGSRAETQTDMFGTMLKQDLILPERIKILKSALTSLRKDKALFKTLTDREGRIAEEGNVLAGDRNARVLARANQLFENIKALAQRKGEISDALQRAAVTSKENGNRGAAVKQFLADVRTAVESGRLDGDKAGGSVGAVDAAPAGTGGTAEGSPAGGNTGAAVEPRGFEFADPDGKPEAFDKQRKDLARSLGGDAMEKPAEPGELGPAGDELRAFDLFDPKDQAPALPGDEKTRTIGDLKSELEKDARAVERLRRCAEEGGDLAL